MWLLFTVASYGVYMYYSLPMNEFWFLFYISEITIGFESNSGYSVNETDVSGTVSLNVRVLKGILGEGITLQVMFTTLNGSAHGNFID